MPGHIVSFEISAEERERIVSAADIAEVRSPEAIAFDAACVEIERAEIESMYVYEDMASRRGCVFCGGMSFIDHGSYNECASCGAI